jgi:Phytanoyl-CoA dioxygenase (PhyH)
LNVLAIVRTRYLPRGVFIQETLKPGTSILTSEQLDEFDQRGVLRLAALFTSESVRRAREHLQRRLERAGLWRDKHADVEQLLEAPRLVSAVEALFGSCGFDRTLSGPPQILFTLPKSGGWRVPTSWHADSPRLASGRPAGVQLFAFLETVEPRGGGTLVISGSHRLLNQKGAVGDVALEVVELTGAPGDAYFTDLRVLHTGAPNATDHPRTMATQRFVRADVVEELTQGYGWG